MVLAAEECKPLARRLSPDRGRVSIGGALVVSFAAFTLFAVASFSARAIFPRGVAGRATSNRQVASLASNDGPVFFEDETLTTLAPVHVTTAQCTGDRSLPAVKGVDLVAYFGKEPGESASFGSERHAAEYNGYMFFFSSVTNKEMFQRDPARYLPAWGGFCSYGISHEIVWNADNLGPKSNPDYWMIVDERLYLFRSSVPMGKFQTHLEENIRHGTYIWDSWFAAASEAFAEDGVKFTPFNTACFCTVDACVDA